MGDVFSESENTDLPMEAQKELVELERELRDGEITEKGFEKKRDRILEKWSEL
jgi:hypothetical protein